MLPKQPVILQCKSKLLTAMSDNQRKIQSGDTVFVSLVQNGRSVLALCSREFGSFAELVKKVYAMAHGCLGMAIMDVRNQSQGWSCRVPLMLAARQQPVAREPRRTGCRKPRQQELPSA